MKHYSKPFTFLKKMRERGQKLLFFFFRSSYDKPCYEARQLSHNGRGLTQVGIESTNACLLTNAENNTKAELSTKSLLAFKPLLSAVFHSFTNLKCQKCQKLKV